MTLRKLSRMVSRDTLTLVTNMTGLSLGLAASILLATFILFELSFDKHFSHADRIYRLNSIWIEKGERQEMPINIRGAYTQLPQSVAGVESCIQIYRGGNREVLRGDDRHKELQVLYTDPEFFRIFDLNIRAGDHKNPLGAPGSVVLSQESATKFFGQENPVGQSFEMDLRLYTVSAVVENTPPNTHFRFDMLMPMEDVEGLDRMGGLEFFTYFLLEEGSNHAEVVATIAQENSALLTAKFAGFGTSTFDSRLSPLARLHLHSGISWDLTTPGSIQTIYIMLAITLAVMALALSNFINLFILNGARRSREIGVRKVNGASRPGLVRQFYQETTLVVSIAFVAGVILALMLMPAFGRIMQRESFSEVTGTPVLYLVLGVIYLLTILLSGFYPALLLSRAAPIPLIRGMVNPAGDKRILLRLVSVVQLCVAIALLAILLGINTQIRFLKNRSLGYEPENMLLVYNLNEKLSSNYTALKDLLLSLPSIEEVGASSHTIGRGFSGQGILMYGEDPSTMRSIAEYRIWPGVDQLYRIQLAAGRYLDPERPADRKGVILNRKAVEMLGHSPESIIGEQVEMHSEALEVIGVAEDFHYESAAVEVMPLVLTAYSDAIRCIAVRYRPGEDAQQVVQELTRSIRQLDPDYVPIQSFATDICASYYKSEERLQKILLFGSLFSLLIVMLGIYALVSHNLVSRTKEIGIRKVMGGSTGQMMRLIYTSSLKWTLLASLLALPLAWLYLDRWLNAYVLRISLSWWIFAAGIAMVLLIQSLITLGQTRSTARKNPVEALRYE